MNEQSIRDLLARVAQGQTSIDQAMHLLRSLPYEDAGCAMLDHHRAIRQGFPEVIFCPGKTPQQVAEISARLAAHNQQLLGTRATPEQFEAALQRVPDLQYHQLGRAIYCDRNPSRPRHDGIIVMAAGTADLPIAEEAALTADLMGHRVHKLYDVGVSGLHRLLPHVTTLQAANVIVVVAGMDGALPSVIGGLVAIPVIAVPTSVGYGASFGGIAALLTMLNSCAAGVAVMNIDNGFGAGRLAAIINGLAHKVPSGPMAEAKT